MAKIFKVSGYIIDPEGVLNTEYIEELLCGCYSEDKSKQMFDQHTHVEEAEFEWDDHNPLNYHGCDLAYCEQYFNTKPMPVDVNRQLPEAGDIWRHFKTGKEVEVLHIAQSTENLGEFSVIYKCGDSDKVWSRPLWMFMSRTDRIKYPDVEQDWRFELVSRKEKQDEV